MKFHPLRLGKNKQEGEKNEIEIQFIDAMSLEQIIMTQKDEPQQKNCIYKMKVETMDRFLIDKFYQIRVKSIEYL